MTQHHRIQHVELLERGVVRRAPQIEHDRTAALQDLLTDNRFHLPDQPQAGPFRLYLSISENRLRFDIRDEAETPLSEVVLSITPFRAVIRDYFLVCDSYYQAIRDGVTARVEAIDMGRRGLHDEGAGLLQGQLQGRIDVDHDTARRLFTLICVLHIRG